MSVFNIALWAVMLLLVPTCVGVGIARWFHLPDRVHVWFLIGSVTEWAIIQLLSVPMTLMKASFVPLVWMISIALGALAVYGVAQLVRLQRRRVSRNTASAVSDWSKSDVAALVIMIGLYLYMAISTARLQFVSRDDARFVVMAVDIEHTNRLFLTDFGTGQPVSTFLSTLRHDLFSPWAVYLAYVSRMTFTPVAIIAHTALPQSLLLCMVSAYLLVADRFFGQRRFEKYSMVILALLIASYSGYSVMPPEGYFIRRPWQGKAMVAGVGIPILYLSLTRLWNDYEGWKPYLLEYLVILSMCLMSAMGFILGSMICGAFGLVYGVRKKKLSVALKTWGGAFICFFYVGVMLLRLI